MWQSVFLHEFLGLDLRNFQAVDGRFSTQRVGSPQRESGFGVVRLLPLASLRFDLASPWDDVVGLSARIRLRATTGSPLPMGLIQLGDAAEIRLGSLRARTEPASAEDVLVGRVSIRLQGEEIDLGQVSIPQLRFVDLRIDWHTSGVTRLSVDGQLLAYRNSIAAGAQVALGGVLVLGPDPVPMEPPPPPPLPPPPPIPTPSYDVAKIFVRALRRPDSLLSTIGLIGKLTVSPDERLEECIALRENEVLQACDRLRAFASLVVGRLTAPGDVASGTLEGAFSPQALTARQLALDTYRHFARMVESRDYSSVDGFLETYSDLLEILHQALPLEFEALVAGEVNRPSDNGACQAAGEAIINGNADTLRPFIQLLRDMGDRLKTIAGVR